MTFMAWKVRIQACSLFFQGMSATARKRKEELAQALKKLIQNKGKTPSLRYQQLFDDLRAQSETVSSQFCIFKSLCAMLMVFASTWPKIFRYGLII